MKVVAYCPILYGKEYLRQAILSVLPVVDRIIFLYTSVGSYGHHSEHPCPETEEELADIALSFPKVQWIAGQYTHEGEHRQTIFNHLESDDLILAFDADEVYETESLIKGLEYAMQSGKRNHGVNGFVNFFRNFSSVCNDGFRPVRIINPNIPDSAKERDVGYQAEVKMTIYHFGCCQSYELIKYKWEVHGHKSEIRGKWLEQIYLDETIAKDVHPVALGLWNVEHYDKTTLPKILKQHPNYNKEFV